VKHPSLVLSPALKILLKNIGMNIKEGLFGGEPAVMGR
jgi:hypothetical protein